MNLTRVLMLPACVLVFSLAAASAGEWSEDEIAAWEGGTPLPDGSHEVHFPAMAKQSVTFVSEAAERIAGLVEFDGESSIGRASIGVDGESVAAESHLTINVADMRTGNDLRDEHLRSPYWMDAEEHAQITVHLNSLERLSDTVYAINATWTIKGVSKEMTSLANIRFIPEFPNFGENIVRVRTSLQIPIKEFGITHEAVGSPAVAEVWDIDVVLLGLPVEED